MVERKPLSKKIRFEVFKRDSFTCQYCGSKAPDVILEIDHIKPVAKGGKNEIINLVTSCFDCNRGKSKTELSDDSIVERQRKQIEELNLRRLQLEMMLNWRDGIADIEKQKHKAAIDLFNSFFKGCKLSSIGEKNINGYVKKFGLSDTLDAIQLSIDKYMKSEDDFVYCLNKIGGILACNNMPEDKKKIAYIKGICRNKFTNVPEPKISILLEKFVKNGYDLDQLQEMLVENRFRYINEMFNWMEA